MSPVLITASQVQRNMECPGGMLLPSAEDPSEAAAEGTALHDRLLRPETFPEPFRAWTEADGEDGVAGARTRGTRFEAALIREGDGPARVLGYNIGRAYGEPALPSLAGTADVLRAVRTGGVYRLRVPDLKTGHAQLYGGVLPEPAAAWQLRTLAYLAWDASGRPEQAEVRLAWLLHDDGDDPPRSWVRAAPETFGSAALREWEAVLLDLLRRRTTGEVRDKFRRGPWCLGCSSFDFCPAQRDVVERVATRSYTPADLGALSPAELADLWLDVRCAEEQAARARSALLRHVEAAGRVPLGDGRTELIPARQVVRRFRNVGEVVTRMHAANLRPPLRRDWVTLESVRDAFAAEGRAVEVEPFLKKLEQDGVLERTSSRPFLQERQVGARRIKE